MDVLSQMNEYLAEASIRIGLVASFFCEKTRANESAVIDLFESWVDRFGAETPYFSDSETDRIRPLDARTRNHPRSRWPKCKGSLLWSVTSTDSLEMPAGWSCCVSLKEKHGAALDSLYWTLDPSRETPDTLLSSFLEFGRRLRCLHAYGGAGVVQPIHPIELQESEPDAVAVASRFHGLDVLGVGRTACDAMDGIKCVNWLTLVGEPLLKKIGGRDMLRSRFGSEIALHDVLDGVVIQAGPLPLVGDAHAEDGLALYRDVAVALRPIFAPGPDGRFRPMRGFSESTTAWRNRFFPGAKWPL
jgi:hypothetical protein